jgi:subtilase family serine protease
LVGGLCGFVIAAAAGCSSGRSAGTSSETKDSAGSPALSAQTAAAQRLVVEPIDESRRVVLPGNTRSEVRPEFDRGAVDDALLLNGMQLVLRRSPDQEQAAEAFADELHRAGSPGFHQWLTAEQYAEQFGAAQEDITTVSAWLRGHGFTQVTANPNRMIIDFSGTAGQVRETFRTEIHALEVKGVRHIANVSDPQIPSALAPVVEGIVSLNDFRPKPMLLPRKSQYTIPGDSQYILLVPADLATIYNFNPLFSMGITGRRQTVAVVNDSDLYNNDDWTTFRQVFGLDMYEEGSLTVSHPGGCSDPGVNPNGDDIETAVDTEWASAAAPNARIISATCANTTTTFGGLIGIQNLLNEKEPPAIISLSYGECEAEAGATTNAAFRAAYLQAALEGISVYVAAGDNGAAICDNTANSPAASGIEVNGFASTAYNVAVGGTDLGDYYAGTTANYWSPTNGPTYGSALSYVPEIPWNDTCASALISNYYGFSGPDSCCADPAFDYLDLPFGGGGGPSNCAIGNSDAGIADKACHGWPKPSWQKGVLGNPNDGVRDLPDLAMYSGDGIWGHAYVFCNSDPTFGYPCVGAPVNWSLNGGTSFASPIMAGVQALVDQVWDGSQGNAAPVYYAIAGREYDAHGKPSCDTFADGGPSRDCSFHDVTIGDNDMVCVGPVNCYAPYAATGAPGVLSTSDTSYQPTYLAGTGWDFATGLGTVNATNVVLDRTWGGAGE